MMQTTSYTIDTIRDEARHLVDSGVVGRQQPIYILCQFIPPREWICVEYELEQNDFLPRDPIIDLLDGEEWKDD
ncbi:DUF4327 family protein [Candidatus Gracilibacteria bacterium]|nr:DUF4327 family protein [Candidatus Gracilibacteria bacterium]NJM88430.1 DUF4327 family protein [Hydrococcus sp. RU_2_2]NJP19322.1 DUF4327 family protein [Hydrococcus sp. CRU_1_1]